MLEWSPSGHILSVTTPVNFRRAGAAESITTTSRLANRAFPALRKAPYSPGVIRCAVVVPAFMIHTPPCLPFSGSPNDFSVAPGTAIVMWGRA